MPSKKRSTSNKRATAAKPAAQPAAPAAPINSTPAAQATAYKLGAKVYNPRASTMQGNAQSWATVQAYLAANGGQATLAALQAHLAQAHNHGNFAKYAIRRGWLVASK